MFYKDWNNNKNRKYVNFTKDYRMKGLLSFKGEGGLCWVLIETFYVTKTTSDWIIYVCKYKYKEIPQQLPKCAEL